MEIIKLNFSFVRTFFFCCFPCFRVLWNGFRRGNSCRLGQRYCRNLLIPCNLKRNYNSYWKSSTNLSCFYLLNSLGISKNNKVFIIFWCQMASNFIINGKLKLFEIFTQFNFSDFSLNRVELKSFWPPPTSGTAIAFNQVKITQRKGDH